MMVLCRYSGAAFFMVIFVGCIFLAERWLVFPVDFFEKKYAEIFGG